MAEHDLSPDVRNVAVMADEAIVIGGRRLTIEEVVSIAQRRTQVAANMAAGNAKQAAHFYRTAMGFEPVAYAGPETGMRGLASYVLRQGQITLLLTSGMGPDDPITQFCHLHGDGVREIALA